MRMESRVVPGHDAPCVLCTVRTPSPKLPWCGELLCRASGFFSAEVLMMLGTWFLQQCAGGSHSRRKRCSVAQATSLASQHCADKGRA